MCGRILDKGAPSTRDGAAVVAEEHYWERGHIDEGAPSTRDGAAVVAEELQMTNNNSMGIKSYLDQRTEGFLIDD